MIHNSSLLWVHTETLPNRRTTPIEPITVSLSSLVPNNNKVLYKRFATPTVTLKNRGLLSRQVKSHRISSRIRLTPNPNSVYCFSIS